MLGIKSGGAWKEMKTVKTKKKETRLLKTHVPDKVYSYSLQVRHVLFELLNCNETDTVSIEVFDDVAVEKDDGSIEAIQLKSVLSKNNPISDRAVDLWKTFYNWLLAVNEGELNPDNTIFELVITANREGKIANFFSSANSLEEAEEMWEKARLEFFDDKGREKKLSETNALYINNFFDPLKKHSACKIIKNFKLVIIEKNHTEFLYDTFCQKVMIPNELLENAFIFILGWIDKKTAELIEKGQVMSISFKEFKSQLIAITRELNQNLSLRELAPRPTDQDIENEYSSLKKYIEQLNIIDCNYTEKIEAISDYLRASTNRTLWARNGYISEKSLDDYEEELVARWNNKKKIIDITQRNLSSKDKGSLLYLQCKDERINIDYLSVPGFFTPGCYHALSDELIVGWHPDYKNLLKNGSEENGTSE
jgi:hypothetical protein